MRKEMVKQNHHKIDDDEPWIMDKFQLPVVNEFCGISGIQVNLDCSSTPLDCFRSFIDDELLNKIVQETNSYAKFLLKTLDTSPRSRIKLWKDTNASEISTFLALILLMGTIRKPTLPMYFSKDHLLATPIFGNVMPKNRFLLLLSCLHFSNNSYVKENDKLHKLQIIIDHLQEKFKSVYIPREHICIDESLMLWKGRLGFKQYIPRKRARYGIKSYELCESTTGYVWNFLIYTGASTKYNEEDGVQGEKVVMTLIKPLLGNNYKLYTDRFFTSPVLAKCLLDSQTYLCGTVFKNQKGMPKNFPQENLALDEMKVCQKNGIAIYAWKDTNEVLMLSTMHSNSFIKVNNVDSLITKLASKPCCVADYNKYMGGIDLCDSFISAYPSLQRSLKWYKKVFFHMLDITMHNSWIIYKSLGNVVSLLDFRNAVVRSLLQNYYIPQVNATGGRNPNPLRLLERHFPSYNPSSKSKTIPYRRCRVCSNKNLRRETRFQCAQCNVSLCIVPCFQVYHTKLRF